MVVAGRELPSLLLGTTFSAQVELGHGGRKLHAELFGPLGDRGSVQVFGHEVTWILLAWDLEELEVPGMEALLHPKKLGVNVPGLAQTAAVADAACGSRVRVDPTLEHDAQVCRKGDESKER